MLHFSKSFYEIFRKSVMWKCHLSITNKIRLKEKLAASYFFILLLFVKSHVNILATKLNQANAMVYRVRDFVHTNILQSIYYALFEDKTLAQSTASAFSRKMHLELSILKGVMLTHLLCLITLELSKVQVKF